ITDHNASANVRAVQKAADGTGLTVLPGMEVQSREDVHLLCIFASLADLENWQHQVDLYLPDELNPADHLGEQFVVDEEGEFIRSEPRLLLTASNFAIEEIIEHVNKLHGIVIPAHVDRTAYGLFPTLGFLADWWHFPALEISRHSTPSALHQKFPSSKYLPLIQSGDAHRLNELLGSMVFELEAPTLNEILMALGSTNNRKPKCNRFNE
ncbi:MAG: hypothetical protein RIR73_2500, partial [Chloroflexota bacterium]